MLKHNLKGFVTSLFVGVSILSIFFLYKGFLEPKVANKSVADTSSDTAEPKVLGLAKITPKATVFPNKVEVYWTAPIEEYSAIMFSENREDCIEEDREKCLIRVGDNSQKQSFTIENLKENTNYYYRIKIGNDVFPKGDTYVFTTPRKPKKNTKWSEDIRQFVEARKEQNLDFDFNEDGVVNILDQPYFLEGK